MKVSSHFVLPFALFSATLAIIAFFVVSGDKTNRSSEGSAPSIERHKAEAIDRPDASNTFEVQERPAARPASDVFAAQEQELRSLAHHDLAAAVAKARATKPEFAHLEALRIVAEEVTSQNLDRLLPLLKLLTEANEQSTVLEAVGTQWGKRDSDHLFAYSAANLKGGLRNGLESAAVQGALNLEDWSSAAKLANKMSLSFDRSNLLISIAKGIFQSSPDEAIRWAISLDMSEDRAGTLSSLLSLAKTSKRRDLIERIAVISTAGDAHEKALDSLTQMKVDEEGQAATLGWIGTLNGAERDTATLSYVRLASTEDSPTSLLNMIASMQNKGQQTSAYGVLFQKITEMDPQAAASAAISLPDTSRHTALASIVGTWYSLDSVALSEWVSSLPSGKDRDFCLSGLAVNVAHSDRETALKTAQAIADPTLKAQIADQIQKMGK